MSSLGKKGKRLFMAQSTQSSFMKAAAQVDSGTYGR
jgi:hypothetical protein